MARDGMASPLALLVLALLRQIEMNGGSSDGVNG
jgi:hypothetical protein